MIEDSGPDRVPGPTRGRELERSSGYVRACALGTWLLAGLLCFLGIRRGTVGLPVVLILCPLLTLCGLLLYRLGTSLLEAAQTDAQEATVTRAYERAIAWFRLLGILLFFLIVIPVLLAWASVFDSCVRQVPREPVAVAPESSGPGEGPEDEPCDHGPTEESVECPDGSSCPE